MWWIPVLLPACTGVEPDPAPASPGLVVPHRLNRAEYDNTVRDLFGTSLRPSDAFPADDFALGFDNIANVLSYTALHLEMHEIAANQLIDELFAQGTAPTTTWTVEAETDAATADVGAVFEAVAWVLWSEGSLTSTFWVPTTGDYLLSADVFGEQAGDDVARMAWLVDGATTAEIEVPEEAFVRKSVRVPLAAGRHELGVGFVNDYKEAGVSDRNLVVDRLLLQGALDVPKPPALGYDLVIDCDPAVLGESECAEHVTRTFGRRAFRRPLSEAEVADRMALYVEARAAGGDWQEGVRALLQSLLLSPDFLYRSQPDPADGARPLRGFELASRLSYFLWSSTPDDRLLDLAQSGALQDPLVLEAEARRMLADPKSEALIDNLGGQLLGIRKVEEAKPNAELFPEWDEGLAQAMQDEMRLFVADVVRSDRSMLELFSSDRTFVDARLAEHYGLPAPTLPGFQPVTIPERAGLLTRGGLLSALAYPTRTSPVVRGNWVLGNLLCAAPPPPPPDVPALAEDTGEVLSLREQLEAHRADDACAGCHESMDAIGLALEPFDAIGRYREIDEYGLPIDATGELPGYGSFDGAREMQTLLAQDPRMLDCLVERVTIYALGRGLITEDADAMASIQLQFRKSGERFEELVLAIVMSRPFRYRDGVAP